MKILITTGLKKGSHLKPTRMITNINTTDKKQHKVDIKRMFDGIASRYDLLNHLLSFGIDRYWRRAAIGVLKVQNPQQLLDIATGTADLAIEAAKIIKPSHITGIDISSRMLQIGHKKINEQNMQDVISLQLANACDLPFDDNSFDAVTIGFGIRNFTDMNKSLREIKRVLKKNGSLSVLEFSEPDFGLVKKSFDFYFSKVLPFVGNKISRHNYAYKYLKESVADFPSGKDFLKHISDAGLSNPQCHPLTFGIASIYYAKKN